MWAWDAKAVGRRVKEERESRKWSLRDLAARTLNASGVKVSYSYIAQLENGEMVRPGKDKIEAIFKAFGLELSNEVADPVEPSRGDARLDGADVNLLAVKNLSREDFEALRAEILRRKQRLEEEQERGRRR